jgi:D-lyxose ketol-isomerase
MKRSDVNRIIREAESFIRSHGFVLPPFSRWTPKQMSERKSALGALIDARLGWDITDYGLGDFGTRGLTLFTARNGDAADLARGSGMLYAEKIMISRLDQLSPMHRHIVKAEDIINRGGGTLVLRLFASRSDGSMDTQTDVTVPSDGMTRRLPPGGHLRLEPGESVTLLPGLWHAFWAEGGDVLIGEVSTVNDDVTDNIFAERVKRFTHIEEDEEPYRLLVSDYATHLG